MLDEFISVADTEDGYGVFFDQADDGCALTTTVTAARRAMIGARWE